MRDLWIVMVVLGGALRAAWLPCAILLYFDTLYRHVHLRLDLK